MLGFLSRELCDMLPRVFKKPVITSAYSQVGQCRDITVCRRVIRRLVKFSKSCLSGLTARQPTVYRRVSIALPIRHLAIRVGGCGIQRGSQRSCCGHVFDLIIEPLAANLIYDDPSCHCFIKRY